MCQFFSRTPFDPFCRQKNFGDQWTFFHLFKRFSAKKILDFFQKQKPQRIHSQKWPWKKAFFRKKWFFIFMNFGQKSFSEQKFLKNAFIGFKTLWFAIFFVPIGFFERFAKTSKLQIFEFFFSFSVIYENFLFFLLRKFAILKFAKWSKKPIG